jgi:hypothetical protein
VGCPGFKVGEFKICRLDVGDLEVGELKPADSAGEWLGITQVAGYADQLRTNLESIEFWVGRHGSEVDPPNGALTFSVGLLTDRYAVPTSLMVPRTSPIAHDSIQEYYRVGERPTARPRARGKMTIEYSGHDGIFVYRWHPIHPGEEESPSDLSLGPPLPELESATEAQTEASPESQAVPEPPTFSPESWSSSDRLTEMFVYLVNAPREYGVIVLRQWLEQLLQHLHDYMSGIGHALKSAFGLGGSLQREELDFIFAGLEFMDALINDFLREGDGETVNAIFDLMQELIIYIHTTTGWEAAEDLWRGKYYIAAGVVIVVLASYVAAAIPALVVGGTETTTVSVGVTEATPVAVKGAQEAAKVAGKAIRTSSLAVPQ